MRVLVLSDGLLTTGFGNVARHIMVELVRRGHEVHQIAGLDCIPADPEPYRALGVEPYFPMGQGALPLSPATAMQSDMHGFSLLGTVLPIVKPDVLLLVQHPGGAEQWLDLLARLGATDIPTVLYAPFEGFPAPPGWIQSFLRVTRGITCTQWGSDRLKPFGLNVPFAYHGVDRTVFRPLDQWRRNQVRRDLGWHEKFVVTYVARNAGRKQQVRLLDALFMLVQSGVTDVHLYLHCRPFEGYSLDGWDLNFEVMVRNLQPYVEFAPQERTDHGMAATSLAERMAAADLCVYPSALEGFGLPILEAMAVGLPLAVTQDSGNMQEIAGEAPFAWLTPHDTTSWFNGARLCHVAPGIIAQTIMLAKQKPRELRNAAARSLQRANESCFSWENCTTMVADACHEAAGLPKWRKLELVTA